MKRPGAENLQPKKDTQQKKARTSSNAQEGSHYMLVFDAHEERFGLLNLKY